MTKEQFENYSGKIYCIKCNHDIPKGKVNHKYVRKDGSVLKCNVCQWIDRHNGIPNIEGLTKDDVVNLLHYALNDLNPTINKIAEMYNIKMDEALMIYDDLRIPNIKISITVKCAHCGKDVTVVPSVYKKNKNIFCSKECYHNYRNEHLPTGEDSQFYKRIEVRCDSCGKLLKIPYNQFNAKNRFGESHNFCSQECYWDFRSKYYVGEKSNMLNHVFTEEQRRKMAKISLENSRKSDRFNTKIQLKVNDILDGISCNYIREYILDYYAVDNYLQDYNLIIEVMGDYWHCSPLMYNDNTYKINRIQQRTICKDKQKHSYILNNYKINILYLWERDINLYNELCLNLIKLYIENNGILPNYNSFNWSLCNNGIILNKELIKPYQERNIEEYRHLFIS